MAQETMDVERIARDYNDLWTGDLSNLDVVADSFSFTAPVDEIHGRDALEEFLREMTDAFGDVEYGIRTSLAGDETVMEEWTWRGTHEGEFDGIPATGDEVELTGMHTLVIADGEVQEDRTYFDSEDFIG